MRLRSTDIKHFDQALTPIEADGDGSVGGHIEIPTGGVSPMYNLKRDNPPTEYHIEVLGELVTDWLVHEDQSISDLRVMKLTDETKTYVFDALAMGMLEIVECGDTQYFEYTASARLS